MWSTEGPARTASCIPSRKSASFSCGDIPAGSLATYLQDLQILSLMGTQRLDELDLCKADFINIRQLRLDPRSVGRSRPLTAGPKVISDGAAPSECTS